MQNTAMQMLVIYCQYRVYSHTQSRFKKFCFTKRKKKSPCAVFMCLCVCMGGGPSPKFCDKVFEKAQSFVSVALRLPASALLLCVFGVYCACQCFQSPSSSTVSRCPPYTHTPYIHTTLCMTNTAMHTRYLECVKGKNK